MGWAAGDAAGEARVAGEAGVVGKVAAAWAEVKGTVVAEEAVVGGVVAVVMAGGVP